MSSQSSSSRQPSSSSNSRTDRSVVFETRGVCQEDNYPYHRFCFCEFKRLSVEEEKYAYAEATEMRREACDAINRYFGSRRVPRNIWQRMRNYVASICWDILRPVCCPPCPRSIVAKLALVRLPKPTYVFVGFGSKKYADETRYDYRLQLHTGANLLMRINSRRYLSYFGNLRCFYVDCPNSDRKLACVYARNFSCNPISTSLTLLYSLNNGIDLGLSVGYLVRLARRFGVDVFSYDYAGFGLSTGSCSESGVYQSVEIAYDYLTKTLLVPPEQIIAIGTSLGTSATIHLASKRPVKAVVLQGAFLSAYRVVCPFERRVSRSDQYTNIEKISAIRVPTLFVHGQKDKLFRLRHAKLLRRNCPGAAEIEPLYVENCGHLGFDDLPEYWSRLHTFLHGEVVAIDPSERCCTQKTLTSFSLNRAQVQSDAALVDVLQLCDKCLVVPKGPSPFPYGFSDDKDGFLMLSKTISTDSQISALPSP